mgnify:CR=1 FL=1
MARLPAQRVRDLLDKTRHKGLRHGMATLPASYWGMQLAHLGLAVCALGVVLSSNNSAERDLRMAPGESVELGGYHFLFQGAKHFEGPNFISDKGTIVVSRDNDERDSRSRHGLVRTLVNNMMIGVTEGYTKELDIIGVGYRAEAQGPSKLKLALGFSHPVVIDAPEGVTFEVPAQTKIIVKGADKEVVGQVAANIREIRKPEPYKGKGVRYLNEKVLRKAGKTGKK